MMCPTTRKIAAITVIAFIGVAIILWQDKYGSSLAEEHAVDTNDLSVKYGEETPKQYEVNRSLILRLNETTDMTLREIQIENYKRGNALMLFIHITHHAGTAFCNDFARINGNTPSFACMGGDNFPPQYDDMHSDTPWSKNDTGHNIDVLREYFHEISWEFGHQSWIRRPLNDTDWENERLLSVIVMRNPMDRLLAGDGKMNRQYGLVEERNSTQWWAYTQHPTHNNNFALRVLSDYQGCCQGKNTSENMVDLARSLLSRFTIILDQDCLDDSLLELARQLDLGYNVTKHKEHASARERIGDDEVYEYLLEKNTMDMKLYEWAKGTSLVTCD